MTHEFSPTRNDAIFAMVVLFVLITMGGMSSVWADKTACDACHTSSAWTPASFAHERTGFPLRGAHRTASCRSCHREVRRHSYQAPLGKACHGCHSDPHRRALGIQCVGCHNENRWKVAFSVAAHDKTAFPLIGSHAALPCQECHIGQRDRAYNTRALRCVACHESDYEQTTLYSLDHRAANFSTECGVCHAPWSFRPAQYPAHEVCFPIARGDHAGIPCLSCHNLIAMGASIGDCNMGTAQCVSCHEHRCSEMDDEHRDVAGYQCQSQSCYACHPDGDD